MTDLSGDGVRVLLLATATHEGPNLLPSVPAVTRSFEDLGRAFAERCGVRPDRLRVVLDPPDARTMAEAVAEAARQAETVLLVYFIGHGLMLPTGDELYLAARSTDELVPGLAEHQALSFSALQQALVASRASSVMVVLDCCFSGKPRLRDGLSVPAFTGVEAAHGRYLIGSAEQLALAPQDAAHTAFTGAFLDVLEHGDRRGPGSLTLDAVYDAVFRKLAGRPAMQLSPGAAAGLRPLADIAPERAAEIVRRLLRRPGPFHRALAALPVTFIPATFTTDRPVSVAEQAGEHAWTPTPTRSSSTRPGATSTAKTPGSATAGPRHWWNSLVAWWRGQ
ncbi:caspase family protein [Amycolatopsis sp. NPDC051128]|uniref:caspase, EACC1-associated type n=1 Tax=Amycolatopsis sp. NPDC051128 TaxID=3155412 RepID=UPI0034290C9C